MTWKHQSPEIGMGQGTQDVGDLMFLTWRFGADCLGEIGRVLEIEGSYKPRIKKSFI